MVFSGGSRVLPPATLTPPETRTRLLSGRRTLCMTICLTLRRYCYFYLCVLRKLQCFFFGMEGEQWLFLYEIYPLEGHISYYFSVANENTCVMQCQIANNYTRKYGYLMIPFLVPSEVFQTSHCLEFWNIDARLAVLLILATRKSLDLGFRLSTGGRISRGILIYSY